MFVILSEPFVFFITVKPTPTFSDGRCDDD